MKNDVRDVKNARSRSSLLLLRQLFLSATPRTPNLPPQLAGNEVTHAAWDGLGVLHVLYQSCLFFRQRTDDT
ncbi:hypothetical protein ACFS07_35220 [Undibacterium arcticum]